MLQPDRLAFGIIPWYSLIIVFGIAIGIYLCGREEKRLGLPKDTAIDSALWAIPFGIIGARLYYVAFAPEQFLKDPIRILYVWEGGVAIYGALIGGAIGVWINAIRKKISFLTLLDMFAPAVILGQAIGRWGNFFNKEAYGYAVTNTAWQFFPFAVFIDNAQGGSWHLATFFYESALNFISFILLMANRKRMKRSGDVFLWYILLYGAGRAIIEGLRMDSLMWLDGTIRVSQWLSVIAMAAAFMLFVFRLMKHAKLTASFCIVYLLHLLYLLYISRSSVVPMYVWPSLNIAIVILCAAIMSRQFVSKESKSWVSLLPLWILSVATAVFLVYWNGMESMLPAQTMFIALISFSFPAGALAIYSHTIHN